MTTFQVRAKRWDRGWELHIDGVGVTQSHKLTDAQEMARSYIAMTVGIAPDAFDVVLIPEIGDGLDAVAEQARHAVRQAEVAQRTAAIRSREVARSLRQEGLTGREIALVLGVSPQRVSQLLATAANPATTVMGAGKSEAAMSAAARILAPVSSAHQASPVAKLRAEDAANSTERIEPVVEFAGELYPPKSAGVAMRTQHQDGNRTDDPAAELADPSTSSTTLLGASDLSAGMTTVNWEREPAEKVEEFVAALLLLEYPDGNLVTPSRGDRGIDIRVGRPDGFDIYQVKRYTHPFTSRQVTDVEKYWSAFTRETLPTLPVRSWTLVTPWDPTNEQLDWLKALTTGAGVRCSWMGRTNLDAMAAQRPSLVDYYFGEGGQQLHRLMTDTLQGGREMPRGVAKEDTLVATAARQRGIVASLNQLDPFYRYELNIRTGVLRDEPWDTDTRGPVAFIRYQQLDDEHLSVLRLIPLSAGSTTLRPITASGYLEVTSSRGKFDRSGP